jgi:hypothetical protein
LRAQPAHEREVHEGDGESEAEAQKAHQEKPVRREIQAQKEEQRAPLDGHSAHMHEIQQRARERQKHEGDPARATRLRPQQLDQRRETEIAKPVRHEQEVIREHAAEAAPAVKDEIRHRNGRLEMCGIILQRERGQDAEHENVGGSKDRTCRAADLTCRHVPLPQPSCLQLETRPSAINRNCGRRS